MYSSSGHPRCAASLEKIWRNVASLAHQLHILWSETLLKTLTDGEVWITVMFYQLFGLSFWRHPFTAEHPLVSKWSKTIFLKIYLHKETNLDGQRLSKLAIHFLFWMN